MATTFTHGQQGQRQWWDFTHQGASYRVGGPGRPRLTYNPDGSLATVNGLAPSLFRLDPLGGIDFASPLLDINVATTVEHSVTERCTSCGCGPQHSQLSRRLGLQKGQVIGAGLGAAACGALGVLAGRLGYIAGAALGGMVLVVQLKVERLIG
eukprot:scaffold11.g4037.t1